MHDDLQPRNALCQHCSDTTPGQPRLIFNFHGKKACLSSKSRLPFSRYDSMWSSTPAANRLKDAYTRRELNSKPTIFLILAKASLRGKAISAAERALLNRLGQSPSKARGWPRMRGPETHRPTPQMAFPDSPAAASSDGAFFTQARPGSQTIPAGVGSGSLQKNSWVWDRR